MINFPSFILPYSTGVNETTKFLPSLPYGSNSPDLGMTANSESESEVNPAEKGA